jgi:hypothetical protein
MQQVYVLHKNGHPLMPCTSAKARILLKQNKAKVVKRSPFTIQLLFSTSSFVQPTTLGIDKGSHETGISCVANNKVVFSAKLNHRTNISEKMTSRKEQRRARRNRKWYRKPRFNNRASSKRSGRIPPSVRANVEEVIRVITKIPLPISYVVVEDVLIDIAKLRNPALTGNLYQQSNRLHENLRLATLLRDNFTCQQCKKRNTPLEAHHIVWRRNGGADTINNLITLCHRCHSKVHEGKISIPNGVSAFKDRIAQRTMQGKAYLYNYITNYFGNLQLVYGYQTSELRKTHNLPKDHDIDAMCVASLNPAMHRFPTYNRNNYYEIRFRPRQTRQQFYAQARKGKGRVRYQVNSEVAGLRKGDLVLVKGKYVKQINSIYSNGNIAFARVKGEPSAVKPDKVRLLEKQKTLMWAKAA